MQYFSISILPIILPIILGSSYGYRFLRWSLHLIMMLVYASIILMSGGLNRCTYDFYACHHPSFILPFSVLGFAATSSSYYHSRLRDGDVCKQFIILLSSQWFSPNSESWGYCNEKLAKMAWGGPIILAARMKEGVQIILVIMNRPAYWCKRLDPQYR